MTKLIPRKLTQILKQHLKETNKGVLLYGSRQVGKTTLVTNLIKDLKLKTLVLNGDQGGDWQEALLSRDIKKIQLLVAGYELLFIDEAQRIPEIGLILKIIIDSFPKLKVVATGSSTLDLASKTREPLTGRVYTYKLYPVAITELKDIFTPYEIHAQLEERLIFGSYPEVFFQANMFQKTRYLKNLVDAYLYKDVLEFVGVKNSTKLRNLLKLLAFQVGSQVSLTELGNRLQLTHNTVDRYIDLLEQAFVVFRLSGFRRNLRREVGKMDKIYFWDLGVRNTLVDNFNFLNLRNDVGALWENFLIVERIKQLEYKGVPYSHYFWRLSSGAELDLVESRGGRLYGYEFKYQKKNWRPPKSWLKAYPNAEAHLVTKDNFLEFVTEKVAIANTKYA